MTPAERIRKAVRTPEPQLDQPKPGSTWELFADRRLTEIEADLHGIRNRIDGLLWSIAAAIALAVLNYITKAI